MMMPMQAFQTLVILILLILNTVRRSTEWQAQEEVSLTMQATAQITTTQAAVIAVMFV